VKDLLKSDRLKAFVNLEKYREETKACRDLKVKLQEFQVGIRDTGKFEAKWTRPYVITKKTSPGMYWLSDTQGRVLTHSWNAENLRRFTFK
jgi:hypothetical protein